MPPSAATPASFGFNDHAATWNQLSPADDARLAARAGATTGRMVFNWRGAEPSPGQWQHLPLYDSIYDAWVEAGIRPLFILAFAPDWTWAEGTECLTAHCRYPPAPAHLDAWRRVVQKLVTRYPELAGIEIWNEPNLQLYWHSGPDPEYYARLVREAHAAVRDAGSDVPIVAGALSANYDDTPTDMSYRTFLRRMYGAGVKGAMDGLSLHPYPGDIDLWRHFKMLDEVRDVKDRAGDDVPLWISELGITTVGGDSNYSFDPNDQAVLLGRLHRRLRAEPDIRAIYVHTLMDPTRFPAGSSENGYGVVFADGTPKPAYCVLAGINGTGYACPEEVAEVRRLPAQELRWEAQELLHAAVDAARVYRGDSGSYAGLSSGALHRIDARISDRAGVPDAVPGPSADPSRIGVWVWADGDVEHLLVCNTSRAERSYCVHNRNGGAFTYGKAEGTMNAAAGALLNGAIWWW